MRNREEVAEILAAPGRIGVAAEVIRRTLDGRLKVAPDGAVRTSDRYLLVGRQGAARPDPVQAAWLYAQMVRWGQAPLSPEQLAAAEAVVRPDLYDAALEAPERDPLASQPMALARLPGRAFDPDDIAGHLAAWKIKRTRLTRGRPLCCIAQISCRMRMRWAKRTSRMVPFMRPECLN